MSCCESYCDVSVKEQKKKNQPGKTQTRHQTLHTTHTHQRRKNPLWKSTEPWTTDWVDTQTHANGDLAIFLKACRRTRIQSDLQRLSLRHGDWKKKLWNERLWKTNSSWYIVNVSKMVVCLCVYMHLSFKNRKKKVCHGRCLFSWYICDRKEHKSKHKVCVKCLSYLEKNALMKINSAENQLQEENIAL